MKKFLPLFMLLALGAAVVIGWPPKPAAAQSASGHEVCVVTATTTSTSVTSLLSTAGCQTSVVGCVKVKTVGATTVCVGGASGTTGDPASLAAGNKCYALPTGYEYPVIAPASMVTLRVQSGTSLVSVATMNGC